MLTPKYHLSHSLRRFSLFFVRSREGCVFEADGLSVDGPARQSSRIVIPRGSVITAPFDRRVIRAAYDPERNRNKGLPPPDITRTNTSPLKKTLKKTPYHQRHLVCTCSKRVRTPYSSNFFFSPRRPCICIKASIFLFSYCFCFSAGIIGTSSKYSHINLKAFSVYAKNSALCMNHLPGLPWHRH